MASWQFKYFNPSLIPRYNWDFSARDFFRSAAASLARRQAGTQSGIPDIFGTEPILTTSGRASLVAILRALQLPHNAGVAVPLYCCPVVFEAIVFAGCRPVFVDASIEDNCISADDLRLKLNQVSAVVAVHMFGHPANMDALRSVAGKIPVIEDCAHSLFSEYHGAMTGSLGDAAFFSFRNGKYLSAGEGSVVVAPDADLRKRIAEIVDTFGQWSPASEVVHAATSYAKSLGYQRPLYGVAGFRLGRAIDEKLSLSAKSGIDLRQVSRGYLRLIEQRLHEFRTKIGKQRENSLALLKMIRGDGMVLPREASNVKTNYYQFGMRLPSEPLRDKLASFLLKRGIDAAKYLDDVVDGARREYGYTGGCPVSEEISRTLLVLPNHYTLSASSIRHIADSVNSWKS